MQNARQLVTQFVDAALASRTKKQRARLWLVATLMERERWAEDVLKEAKQAGFSKTTLLRAAKTVVRRRKRIYNGPWLWSLAARLETRGVDEIREQIVNRLLELVK